ncbi:MAG: sensor histidine kinase [Actinobacteria bacterium]|nr:sensor histidine kinase [Actinomycetota bacterium]
MDLDVLGVLLLGAGPVALVVRRRYPATVLGVVLATTLGYTLLDYPRGPIFLALIVAFVTAVMKGRRVEALVALALGYVGFLWAGYLLGVEPAPSLGEALGLGAWLLLLFAVSEIARARRERAIELARTREAEAKRRAGEERLRIARELHDVLAHNISLINVQAGTALHLLDEHPEQARPSLAAIRQASNEALAELRSVLDILREGQESVPRSPTSRLAHVDDLIAKTEAAGAHVTMRIEGDARPLAPGVDLAAFRVVQEALTNVTKHARDARVAVEISYEDRELTVQIDDDGVGAPVGAPSGGGRGISGMRERAAALGGELEAGPRPGGGFRVRARFPVKPEGAGRP